jgi:NhaA family Na+:H+ antiporter
MQQPAKAKSPLDREALAGLVLMAGAILALVIANSPLADSYFTALKTYVGPLSLLHWINDGLMAGFFLLVGLEIKREMLTGSLRAWPDRTLPGIAALGGMIVPSAIYVALNWHSGETLPGWAIPAATDIAFALGVLALLGSRVPPSLKIFLTALAILDDLGAVLIIALFYSHGLSCPALAGAAATLAALLVLNSSGVTRLAPYLLLGVLLWVFVLNSGVHATVAGVLLAMTIPLAERNATAAEPPLLRLEHALQSWSAFAIVPIFGFANAGVSLSGVDAHMIGEPLTLGIALGLFLGKQAGVFAAVLTSVRLRWATRPADASWTQVYGVAILCGVGFTMSLFIGLLAFPESPHFETPTKIGVLGGSLASMLAGAAVLGLARKPRA